jgi:hypothetical protein
MNIERHATLGTNICSNHMNTINDQPQRDIVMSLNGEESLDTALIVLGNGWATVAQLSEAAQLRRSSRPKIGELAIHEGRMTIAQVFRVLEHEAVNGGLFGENAVEKGLLNEADLYELLRIQAAKTPELTAILLTQGVLTEQQVEAVKQQIKSQYELLLNLNLE